MLASPRRRRRLLRTAVVLAVVGCAVAVGVIWPNTGSRKEVFERGPVRLVAPEAPSRPLRRVDSRESQRVLSNFVLTAVLRRHVDASFDLVTPALKQGLSRADWRTGNIPVSPFPIHDFVVAKSKLVYSRGDVARYNVAVLARPNGSVGSQMFTAELHALRVNHERRWLVDYWMPAGGGISTPVPRSVARAAPVADPPSLGTGWLFAPIGLLSLILLVPIGIAARSWYQTRRSTRAYEAESALER